MGLLRTFWMLWGLAAWLAAAAAMPAAAATKEKVTVALNFVPYGIHTPLYVAQEKGFYDEANLEVTIQRGTGSADAVAKVGAGAAEVGYADAGAVVVGRAKGANVTLVAMLMDKGLATIYTYKGSGITKPKDLEGRTVADNAGGGAGILFPALAAIHGIDTSKVNIVMVDAAAKNPILIERKADAIFTFSTIEPNLRTLAAAKGMEIVGLSYSDWGLDLYGMGLFASKRMLSERRDVVRRWTAATMRAVAWCVENPDEAVALFVKRNQAVSPALARGHWQIVVDHLLTPAATAQGIGFMTDEKWQRTRDVLVKYQKLEGDLPLKDLYTNEFLPKLFPKRPTR